MGIAGIDINFFGGQVSVSGMAMGKEEVSHIDGEGSISSVVVFNKLGGELYINYNRIHITDNDLYRRLGSSDWSR